MGPSRQPKKKRTEILTDPHLDAKKNMFNLFGWWFGEFIIFHNIWDVFLPIDFHIFQGGEIAPPTSYVFVDFVAMLKPIFRHVL